MDGDSYCDVTERLFGEFERVHRLPVIALVVGQCRVDLEGSPRGAVPELLERLARQRLMDLAPSRPSQMHLGVLGDAGAVAGGAGGAEVHPGGGVGVAECVGEGVAGLVGGGDDGG